MKVELNELIAHARCVLPEDPHLANYIVRDHPDVKRLGLSDLAWSIHREYGHRNDVEYLLDRLEELLAEEALEASRENGDE